jgi:phenylalanyl-tRNA synthetase beta chain
VRVAYSWLKEYVDPGLSASELAERLTLAGIEVESLERFMPALDRVITGEITVIESHPGSGKLTVVRVETGGAPATVVCGAANIAVGQKVPLALPGANLPGHGRLEAAQIHGVSSAGMLCSPGELGLELGSAANEGILILDPEAPPGAPVDQILGLDDPILYLGLTPNRADCLGLLGVAYEVAALTGARVKEPPAEPPECGESITGAALVRVLDPDLCPRYTARVIGEIAIGPSPLWMQLRLLKAGIRPISNIVDITNYVMWEYGQPLHAFDYDLLEGGEIIVRRAVAGEQLVTLDGVTRPLDPEVLVIADSRGPVGLAGVMGGENTEINSGTRAVLLEAARFHPVNIRRTARRFNLPSEASQRFERWINPAGTPVAQNRAAMLMARLAGGRVLRGMIDVETAPPAARRITVRPHRINEILGVKIPAEMVSGILERLDFAVDKRDSRSLEVTVPLRRGDVTLEEDIVEEVARLYGYENIPVTLPRGELLENREAPEYNVQELAREALISCGFFEAITLSFINPSLFDTLRLAADDPLRTAIPLQNPLSEEQGVMRTTLLPGLLKVLQHNFNYQELNQLLFEIGAVYTPRQLPLTELPVEGARLAVAASGEVPGPNWVVPSREADFFLVKGALETLFAHLGIKSVEFIPASFPFLHPTRSAMLKAGGVEIGCLGQLHPAAAEALNYRQPVIVGELDLNALAGLADLVPRVAALSRYPASRRDIAVIVPRDISAAELERTIRQAGGGLVDKVSLFDLYAGEQIPEGKRSLAFSITYRRPAGTLTEEEVIAAGQRIEQALSSLEASLRGGTGD